MGQAGNNSGTTPTAGSALVKVAIITFAAGLLVMLAVLHFSAPGNQATLIFSSALLLAVLVAPMVYALVLVPMVVALEEGQKPAAKAGTPAQSALTDPVTQLPNRHGITSSLLEFMAHAERYGTPLSIALVQIQNFRKLSDELAPRGAEKAATTMAEVFYDTLRRPDKAGRHDNDEFLVVLPHTKLKDAGVIAERIRTSVGQRELGTGAKGVKMSVTSGAVQFRKGEDLEQLLARAEQAKHGKGGRRAAVKKAAK